MDTAVLLLVAMALPTCAGYLVVGLRRLVRAHSARHSAAPNPASVASIRDDLRRLHDLLERSENALSTTPAKNQRCVASRAAYVDALIAACRQLGVSLPSGGSVPRCEIYRIEADLRRVGVDVRPG